MPALRSDRNTIALLVASSVLVRIVFAFAYGAPVTYPDTRGYELLATMLERGDLTGFDGLRTPVYPILMLLCGRNPVALVAAQMVLGVLTAVILYRAFLHLTGNRTVAFAVGLSHSLNFSQLLFESNLLSETSSTFLWSLALLALFGVFGAPGSRPSRRRALAAGILASLATLDRPLCVVLPVLGGLYLGVRAVTGGAATRRRLAGVGTAYVLPVLLLLGGWSWVNERTTGYFSLSNLTGLNLTHWSGRYIESAPPEFRTIQEIYIPYRDRAGTSAQTIWQALSELRQRTGLTNAQLSHRLLQMSLAVIREHPGAYARQVVHSWIDFWKPSFMRRDADLPSILVFPSRAVIVALELVFLVAPFVWLLSRRVRARVVHVEELATIDALVLATSIAQAFLISVENPRYSAVVDPWTIGTAIVAVWILARAFGARPDRSPAGSGAFKPGSYDASS